MNRFILSVSLVIICCAVSLAGESEVRFASGKSALNIPFRIFNNHIYLAVSVNNSKSLWFLLDTGAGNIIDARQARTLGLKLNPGGQTTGVGEGTDEYFWTENVSFTLPGVTIARERFAVISFAALKECMDKTDVDLQGRVSLRAQARGDERQPFDGVLGKEFIRRFVVEIDYAAKLINLYDPPGYQYRGQGERIPLEVGQKHIYVRAPITASGHPPINGRFIIDSGSMTALMLNSPFVAQNNLLPPPNQTTPFSVCGIGGDSKTQLGNLAEISLGNIKLENPVAMFSQAVNGALADPEVSGSIGNAVLRRFKVVFDYSRRVMILDQK
jgi:Aspartyl protease